MDQLPGAEIGAAVQPGAAARGECIRVKHC